MGTKVVNRYGDLVVSIPYTSWRPHTSTPYKTVGKTLDLIAATESKGKMPNPPYEGKSRQSESGELPGPTMGQCVLPR